MNLEPETKTAAELANIIGITKRAVNLRAEKEAWPYLNGDGNAKRYLLADLPEGVRLQVSGIRYPVLAEKEAPVAVGSPELSEQQNKVALARADLIRHYQVSKDEARAKKESVVAAAGLFVRGYNTGQLLPIIYSVLGNTSRQTLDAWAKKFRDSHYDYMALAPQYGNRLGQRKVTDDEFNAMLSFALHPNRLRIAEVARLTKTALTRKQIPSPSSKDTLRRALKDFRKAHYDQWVFAREGEKALNDKVLPYMDRDINLLEVGDVLVADGHTLNFVALHPFTGKPSRMTMVTWYDWASCMPVGWEILPTENIQCVAAGLRKAILTLGKMPKVAYLDNGRAFKAKLFTNTDIDFEEAGFYGMFARLGIETVFAWPYHAQSKPVERFFGTFSELERLMPTFTGTSIDDKPARMLRNEKLHQKLHEKKYGGWMPTIDDTHRIIKGWVNEYAQRPHRGLKGLQPGEIFAAGKGPGVNEETLRYLMMSMEIKTVQRNGVNFMGRWYYDESLYGYRDRVMIRYDLEDLSQVHVYDQTGKKLLCEAKALTPVHPMARLLGQPEDLAAVKEGIRLKRSLAKQTEAEARAWVADAPALIEVGCQRSEVTEVLTTKTTKNTSKRIELPRAEAERIEAAAAKMTVIEFKPKAPVYLSEADRYEALLEKECKGIEMDLDGMSFMRYYENTSGYREFKDRFEFLREIYIVGPIEIEKG